MKKLPKIFGAIFLLYNTASLSAQSTEVSLASEISDVHKSKYASVGGIYFYPYVALGHRWQSGHNGADLSLSIAGIPSFFVLGKLDALYLFVPKPNLHSQFYLGTGLGLYAIGPYQPYWARWKNSFALAPELAFGYQYESSKGNMRFVQIEPGYCIWSAAKGQQSYPIITLSYGFGF